MFCSWQEVIEWNFKEIYKTSPKRKYYCSDKDSHKQYRKCDTIIKQRSTNHLKLKHPEAKETSAEVLLDDVAGQVDLIKCDAINE